MVNEIFVVPAGILISSIIFRIAGVPIALPHVQNHEDVY